MRALLISILFLVACSGAAPVDIPEGAKSETAKTLPTGEVKGPTSSQTNPPNGSSNNSPPASKIDPASPNKPPAPAPTEPPPAAPTCAEEIEDNDTQAKATPFTSCIAGKVMAADRDVDYLRITAPDGANTMVIEHKEQGRVVYRVSQEGDLPLVDSQETFTDGTQEISVTGGATYYLRLSGGRDSQTGGGPERAYEVKVSFK